MTQTVDVVVYKLTIADTVEERILELQEKKRLLAMHAIEGGMVKNKKDKESLKLSLDDLLNLFKPRHDDADPFGDTDRFYGFSHKESDDMRGMNDLMRRDKPKKKREDNVYGRRW